MLIILYFFLKVIVTGCLERPVIEEEVAQALPSVKLLAKTFQDVADAVSASTEKPPKRFNSFKFNVNANKIEFVYNKLLNF